MLNKAGKFEYLKSRLDYYEKELKRTGSNQTVALARVFEITLSESYFLVDFVRYF